MEAPLVNRVAESGIITFNLEEYFPKQEIFEVDLKNYLFQGLILREKDFRAEMKQHDWSQYKDSIVCVFCSTDAIIPVWAYMLFTSLASAHANEVYVGTKEEYLKHHYYHVFSDLDIDSFESARVVIKGCSDRPVPPSAYAQITKLLRPVVKSIMYGEPCSTVPIYKRPLKRIR